MKANLQEIYVQADGRPTAAFVKMADLQDGRTATAEQQIATLQAQVADLQARVAALEAL